MKQFVIFCAAAVLLAFCGCGDYSGKENTHPLYVRAVQCRQEEKYVEAARYYEEFLYVCPRSAKTHYELAALYGDNLDNPLYAVFHYEQFIALSPKGSADAEAARKFADAMRKKLVSPSQETSEALEKLKAENERYKQLLQKYVDYSAELARRNKIMRDMIKSGKVVKPAPVQAAEKKEPEQTPQAEQKTPPAPAAQTAVPAAQVKPAAAVPETVKLPAEHKVQSGDSLFKIAKKYYGSTAKVQLIIQANNIRNNIIYVGQKLQIPADTEQKNE